MTIGQHICTLLQTLVFLLIFIPMLAVAFVVTFVVVVFVSPLAAYQKIGQIVMKHS